MANEYTPEEITGIFEAYNNAIKSGTPITQDMANAMKDAEKGIKGYAAAQKAALDKMNKGIVDLTKSMYQGQQGMEAMNGSIDAAVGVLELLINLIPGARLLKAGLALAAVAVGGFVKMTNKQSDQLFKTYQELSKTGAAAAGGMTEITANMQKFGYGLEQLDQMTVLIKENSTALASLGGSAMTGTRMFADVATEIQRSGVGKSLMMLGKSPDEINRGIAMFVKQQQMAGVSSTNIQLNLAARSAEYIKQLDLMSKLTGESAEALQANRDAAMSENAFNQTIYELRKKQAEGDVAAGKRADELLKMSDLLKSAPALQKDFWMSVGGDASAMGRMMTAGMADFALYSQDANFIAAKGLDLAKQGAQAGRDQYGELYKLNGVTDDFLYNAKEQSALMAVSGDKSMQQTEDLAKSEQELQIKNLDKNTKAQVELRINQMKSRDALQSFVTLGVNPATTSLEALSKVANKIAGVVPGDIASGQGIGGGPAKTFGGNQSASGNSANAAAAMKFFQSAGWSKEQAAGIVGNLQAESTKNLNTKAVGDGGKALGIAQWHGDRQAMFKKVMGKDVMSATLEEQLKFVDWELKNTHKHAGDMLRQAKDAAHAAQLVDRHYEVSAGLHTAKRIASATLLAGPNGNYQPNNITGPSNSFDSTLAAITAKTTLPEKETTPPVKDTTPYDAFSEDFLNTMKDALTSMDRRLSNIDDNSKKTAQAQNK